MGAMQVGTFESLISQNPDIDYDIVAGVSVGALASGVLASCERKKNSLVDSFLRWKGIWFGIQGNRDVYRFRLNPLAFIKKNGLYHTNPLREKIEANVCADQISRSGRHVFVGVTNSNMDRYEEVGHSHQEFIEYVIASAAYPPILEPVKINDHLYGDGGIKNNIPCYFLHNFEGQIDHIDLLVTSPCADLAKPGKEIRHILEYLIQTIAGITRENYTNDFTPFLNYQRKYPKTKVRVFAPNEHFLINPLHFDPENIRILHAYGKKIQPTSLDHCCAPKSFF